MVVVDTVYVNQESIENLEPPLGERLVHVALELLAEEGIEDLITTKEGM